MARKLQSSNDSHSVKTQWLGGVYPGIPKPPERPKRLIITQGRYRVADNKLIKQIDELVIRGKTYVEISALTGIRIRTLRDIVYRRGAYAKDC